MAIDQAFLSKGEYLDLVAFAAECRIVHVAHKADLLVRRGSAPERSPCDEAWSSSQSDNQLGRSFRTDSAAFRGGPDFGSPHSSSSLTRT